ncbi:hypothetical protein LTR56_027309 [Elasticomyces elasticus]|nr:hypothetical protein LTR56_027309 [Elasticomyces elasticus]
MPRPKTSGGQALPAFDYVFTKLKKASDEPSKRFKWFEEHWLSYKAGKHEGADAKTAVKKLSQLHLAKQSPIELSPVKPYASPPRTSQRDDDMSEGEGYTAAVGSYTTPPDAAKQKEIERVAELNNLMKAKPLGFCGTSSRQPTRAPSRESVLAHGTIPFPFGALILPIRSPVPSTPTLSPVVA